MKAFIAVSWRIFAMVMAGVLPFVILSGFLGWHSAIKIGIYGFFVAMLATVIANKKAGLILTFVFAGFAALGAAVYAHQILLAIVVALSAAIIPVCAKYGYIRMGIFAAMFMPNTVCPPPIPWQGEALSSPRALIMIFIVTVLGGLWGRFIGGAIGKAIPSRTPIPLSWSAVMPSAVIIVMATGLITFYAVTHFPHAKWAWLLGAIYSMMLAVNGMKWRTSVDLIIGTILGTCVVVLLLELNPPYALAMLLGAFVICCSVAIGMVGKPYWLQQSVSTTGVVLLTSTGMNAIEAAEDRFIFTIVGAIIAAALGVIFAWLGRRTIAEESESRVEAKANGDSESSSAST